MNNTKLGRILYPLVTALLLVISVGVVLGCGSKSNADNVDDNLGKEAEKFNVQRKIVAINGITDKPILEVEGRCSIETNETLSTESHVVLEVICKYGDKDYRKHFVGVSDNVTWTSTQLRGLKVSEYRTKFTFRPASLVPDVDLDTGGG